MTFKLLTYNILYGFHTPPYNPEPVQFKPERLKLAQKIVKKEDPDILVLTEACLLKRMNYKELFGYPHSFFAGWQDDEWGLCILSKYLLEGLSMTFGDRIALRATVLLPGKNITIDVIHPNPKFSDLVHIKSLAPLLKNHTTPYVLTGDFNALSDSDHYNKNTIIKAVQQFFPDKKSCDAFVSQQLKGELIAFVKKHNLRDAMDGRAFEPTFPTPLLPEAAKTRIDYVFVSPDITITNARVITSKDAQGASDHYPICVEFEV